MTDTADRPQTHASSVCMTPLEVLADPIVSAKLARVHYINDGQPGITRQATSSGRFRYLLPDGSPVRDRAELKRIHGLGIPPAWKDVWVSPDPRGHLQATGRDAKGRKQYRYHTAWRELRDLNKYDKMIDFGAALPALRARTERDLARHGLPREKVIATVVRLLERTLIRVGNEEYARKNGSFGLTTMLPRHVRVDGASVRFHFRGKSGKEHNVGVRDRRLARIIKQCQELPGHELFHYVDESGTRHAISSTDVNEYLRDATGHDFSAKDFRTWSGTVLAAISLAGCEPCETESQRKRNVATAVKSVASRLGNTPTICRKCYVHPDVFAAYHEGAIVEALALEGIAAIEGLHAHEVAVLAFLRERATNAARRAGKRGRKPNPTQRGRSVPDAAGSGRVAVGRARESGRAVA